MSTLRQIMQRLAEAESKQGKRGSADFSELIKCHVDEYQNKLDTCTPAMLQYEWAWLNEHIQALELCQSQPTMCHEVGGPFHVEMLLEESRQFQIVLEEMFHTRMIHPSAQHHPINPCEHAWEVSQQSLREMWGLE
jgi:hypothetical protein